MADLPELDEFTAGVYQWETTDPAEAGPDGIMNVPLKAIVNRTRWLKNRINSIVGFPREIKYIAGVDDDFITDNFPSGVGAGIYLGWFVSNGANGTDDMGGLVPVGYGNGFLMGETGGSKDAVVVEHVHNTVKTGEISGALDGTRKYIARERNSGVNIEYVLGGRT